MPRYEDPEFGEYYVHIPDEQGRESLKDIMWGSGMERDDTAFELFFEALFNDNERAYQDLIDYLYDTYGIDFEDSFDWADARDVIERVSAGGE